MKEELTHKDFFYCYDRKLKDYLTENGVRFIMTAYSISNQHQFFLYQQGETLRNLLNSYT